MLGYMMGAANRQPAPVYYGRSKTCSTGNDRDCRSATGGGSGGARARLLGLDFVGSAARGGGTVSTPASSSFLQRDGPWRLRLPRRPVTRAADRDRHGRRVRVGLPEILAIGRITASRHSSDGANDSSGRVILSQSSFREVISMKRHVIARDELGSAGGRGWLQLSLPMVCRHPIQSNGTYCTRMPTTNSPSTSRTDRGGERDPAQALPQGDGSHRLRAEHHGTCSGSRATGSPTCVARGSAATPT